MNVFEANLI